LKTLNEKSGRNDPCLCGSGKKYKKCCHIKLATRLSTQQTSTKNPKPSPTEFNHLIALFNAGRLIELEGKALSMVEQFPDSGHAWKILSITLHAQRKDALTSMNKALELLPEDCEVHNNLGVVLNDLGQFDEAENRYRRSLEIKPDFAEAHYNLGILFRERGRFDDAIASYRQALKCNPDYAVAHGNLGIVLHDLGRLDDAVESYQRALKINPKAAEIHFNHGNALHSLGQIDGAIKSYRCALKVKPDFAEAHNNLGVILRNLGQFDEAIGSFHIALEIKPNFSEAHYNLGNALRDLGRLDDAVKSYSHALEIKSDNIEAQCNLGNSLRDLGRLDDAVKSYYLALAIKPDFSEAHYNLGNALRDLGRLDDALKSYSLALESKPDYIDVFNSLCDTLMEVGKTDEAESCINQALVLAPNDPVTLTTALSYIKYQKDDPRFSQLEPIYSRRESLPIDKRVRLNFAMGKAMESIGQYHEAFAAYKEGNLLHSQKYRFDEAEENLILEKKYNLFSSDKLKNFASAAANLPHMEEERVPIFIVGMPRSGTTLIEQMLSSHADIYGAGELTILGDLAKKAELLLLETPDVKDTLLALRKLGREYCDQVWKRAPDAKFITDKLPGNYQHLWLIHLMLPNAKIIHSIREPMDTCFSCYALPFTFGHEYSYEMETLGRQYLRYKKLMKHWHDVLPLGRILDVRYEDNISNSERELRRILDYLGLPWDPACLKFHESDRVVRTASVAQVRKPIYSSSVARWRNFEKYLSPLRETMYENNEDSSCQS